MADYNIYIHDVNGSSVASNPTKAWTANESNQTKAWAPQNQKEDDGSEAMNVSSAVASFKGIKSAAKAHPVVAVAMAVITVTKKVMDTTAPFVSRETGDTRFQTGWENVKSALGMILNPIGSEINYRTNQQETRIYNWKQNEERLLIGESYTNGNSRRM